MTLVCTCKRRGRAAFDRRSGLRSVRTGAQAPLVHPRVCLAHQHVECAEQYEPDLAILLALGLDTEQMAVLRAAGATPTRGVGCAICGRSGYLGRRGLFEVLEVTADLRRALLTGADETKVADLASQHGYVPLREGGLTLAGRGKTTYEEVLRVTRATI
jgi:type IV pilus assembly protein PilB